ncbi:MAG: DUF2911 domain-containing protein [Candidatus Longimicrobiales bacterium M2_2A_002]
MTITIRRTVMLLAATCAAALATAEAAGAQDLHPSRRPSPIGIAKTHLGDTYVKVTYGRPYVRDRVIFGPPDDTSPPLVPYGRIWRTGANEATEITTTGPLLMAGEPLPAGTYSIFTEPAPRRWRIHVSPQLGLDGTGLLTPEGFTPNVYDPAKDVLVVEARSTTVEEVVDQFTIDFEPDPDGAVMVLRWENTEVRVPIAVPEN